MKVVEELEVFKKNKNVTPLLQVALIKKISGAHPCQFSIEFCPRWEFHLSSYLSKHSPLGFPCWWLSRMFGVPCDKIFDSRSNNQVTTISFWCSYTKGLTSKQERNQKALSSMKPHILLCRGLKTNKQWYLPTANQILYKITQRWRITCWGWRWNYESDLLFNGIHYLLIEEYLRMTYIIRFECVFVTCAFVAYQRTKRMSIKLKREIALANKLWRLNRKSVYPVELVLLYRGNRKKSEI